MIYSSTDAIIVPAINKPTQEPLNGLASNKNDNAPKPYIGQYGPLKNPR